MKVAFLGLGSMGLPMARNVAGAGFELAVWNRTEARARQVEGESVRHAGSIAAAVQDADVAVTMLSDDRALEEVVLGDGGKGAMIDHLPEESIHVSMSTISVACSRRLADRHAGAGQRYVSAPVFGRPDAAAGKKLWICAAGERRAIEVCRPLLESMGQGVFVIGGEAEKANVVKVAGNFMISSLLECFGESLTLVQKSGVDPHLFLEIITSLFKSPIYENYGGKIVRGDFDPGFRLKYGLKDTRLVLAAADEVAVPMPVASVVRDQLLSGVARDRGDEDWSALGDIVAENAGVSRT